MPLVIKPMRILSLLLLLLPAVVMGQKGRPAPPPPVIERPTLSTKDLQKIKLMEDTLHRLSNLFTEDTIADNRKKACYNFIPKFVNALKTDNSFYYPFDSFETVAKVYAPDSSFRIFTWQLYFSMPVKLAGKNGKDTILQRPIIRYYGVIQMKSKELKMYPLFDAGDTLKYGTQQILSNDNWWGQLYYNIIQKTVNGKTYYTTFGFEAADPLTRRKIIDILTFDKTGKPVFGAPMFYFKHTDSSQVKEIDTLTRFFIEYKHNASTILNYDQEKEMIVFDHVAPPNDKSTGATFTYVPDGTYEGFVWTNNRWNWVEQVFTFGINEMDNPPIPAPLFGDPKRQPEMPGDPPKKDN
jgi:hypothetical protein